MRPALALGPGVAHKGPPCSERFAAPAQQRQLPRLLASYSLSLGGSPKGGCRAKAVALPGLRPESPMACFGTRGEPLARVSAVSTLWHRLRPAAVSARAMPRPAAAARRSRAAGGWHCRPSLRAQVALGAIGKTTAAGHALPPRRAQPCAPCRACPARIRTPAQCYYVEPSRPQCNAQGVPLKYRRVKPFCLSGGPAYARQVIILGSFVGARWLRASIPQETPAPCRACSAHPRFALGGDLPKGSFWQAVEPARPLAKPPRRGGSGGSLRAQPSTRHACQLDPGPHARMPCRVIWEQLAVSRSVFGLGCAP